MLRKYSNGENRKKEDDIEIRQRLKREEYVVVLK